MARLILVSNRVSIPRTGGANRAGGLEVALAPILKVFPTVWFGWSGNVVPADKVVTQTIERSGTAYVVTDLSEDIDPQTGTLWGNFPQTYSMAGLILTAMRLSRSWEDRYWRG